MAAKLSDEILDDIRGLIKEVTHFTEDDENFHLCYKYATWNVCNHRFLSVNSHSIKQSLDNLVLRLRVHGHTANAQRLGKLVSDIVNHPVFKNHTQSDIQWSILSLLVNMAGGPTNTTAEFIVESEDEPFDWVAYLREGDVDVHYYSSDTDTDDDWDFLETEEQEVFPLTEEQEVLPPVEGGSRDLSDGRCRVVSAMTCVGSAAPNTRDLIKQCLLSKEWIEKNVQHNWWSLSSISEPGCSNSRLNVAHMWNEYVSQNGSTIAGAEVVNTLSEYKVVREVLFMLRDPIDMRVFVRIGDRFCVRSDVTIPSLTQCAFSKFLQEMCEFFDMLKELLDFVECLRNAAETGENDLLPLTYKAFYYLAVDLYISRLRNAVIRVEAEVRKQEKPNTLISVKMALQPCLDDLKTVYLLHRRATLFPWESSPNWLCATCMLSVVFEELETAVDDHAASTLMSIFMKVFSPYLRIANKWLTGGQLVDVCQEFIIAKSDCILSTTYMDEGFQIRQFEGFLEEKGVKPAPILQEFSNRVLQAGKTIGFLHKMNRVAEIRKQPEACGEFFMKLSGDAEMLSVVLIERVIADVVQIQPDNCDAKSTSDSDNDLKTVSHEAKHDSTFFEFPEHLKQLADPYLLAAFGCSFHTDSQSQPLFPMYTYKMEDSAQKKAFKRLDKLAVSAVLPLQQLLQGRLEQLLGECHRAACQVVRHILLSELLLPTQFSLMRHIVLNEAGDVMHHFATTIFTQVEHGILDTYSLSDKLVDCVDECFPEFSSRFAVADCADKETVRELYSSVSKLEVVDLRPVLSRAVSAMAVINRVQIIYRADWPISLFLNEENMKCYNKVFQFLLEVRWALHLLNHLRFTDMCGPAACTKRLQLLRFWHTHTLSSVLAYLMGQVLQSESFQLQQTLEGTQDLDSFLEAHNNYVKAIYRKCFRPIKLDFIVEGVHQLVAQTYVLKDYWCSMVSVTILDNLEAMYNHTHCMMVAVLRLHVEEDFDSELEGLHSALDDRIPFPGILL